MARLPRFVLPGEPQHVIQRGNNRDIIFVSEDDYHFYLEKLEEACQRFGCQVHAYVLMTNHVHLLITPEEEHSISQVMQSLGRVYVRYFNDRYQRTGTLWEGRYKATLLDSETYLLTCYRYIELNPVRAAMVQLPGEYPWSSYRCNATGEVDSLIVPHDLYLRLGNTRESRCEQYRALFQAHIHDATLEEIREATNKAWVLGNDRFRSRVEDLLERQAAPKPKGGDRKSKKFRGE
ncbi:MAG: transposase [Gammaproteobacteria bacterium]|jgi:putative transposase